MDHSDKLMLSAKKDDFRLDGVKAPKIDLSPWKTVFPPLSDHDHYVIIEKEKEEDPEFISVRYAAYTAAGSRFRLLVRKACGTTIL